MPRSDSTRVDPRQVIDSSQSAGVGLQVAARADSVGPGSSIGWNVARALNDWGDRLRKRLNGVARRHGLALQFTGLGSMFSVHMTDQPIRSQEDAERGNPALRDLFYFDLVARGIWFAKRGMFALSIALDESDSDKLADAVEEFAQTRAPLFSNIGVR